MAGVQVKELEIGGFPARQNTYSDYYDYYDYSEANN